MLLNITFKNTKQILFPAFILYAIIHFNSDVLKNILPAFHYKYDIEKTLSYLAPVKANLFFLAVLYLAWFLKNELQQIIIQIKVKDSVPPLIAFIILELAFWNFMPMSMGYGYAEMSVHPFNIGTGWYYKRLLMPALAYITGFRNIHLYFIFSCFVTYLLMLLVWMIVKRLNQFSANVKLLIFFSLCSLEFISYQFFFPGYADSMLAIFLLLIYLFHFSESSKVRLFVLALATHEISIFLCLPFIFLLNNSSYRIICASIIFIYCILYLIAFQFNVSALFMVHKVEGLSMMQWIQNNYLVFLCGILAAFKLLWIPIIYGVKYSPPPERKMIAGILIAAFVCCFIGVDTSRIMAFAFPALLLSLPVTSLKMPLNLFLIMMIANLLLPHISVSLIMGIVKIPYFHDFIHALLK
jgi:hypothetical protein